MKVCLTWLLGITAAVNGDQRPNLIYILADDYGWFNVGFHNKDMLTPNIDRLATTEGAEISYLYTYRFCSPTRASIMSGRLPYHVNQDNSAKWGWNSTPVHPRMKMLPEKMQEAGYFTVQVGKWHLGLSRRSYTPAGRGCNASLTMLMGSEDHFTQKNGNPKHVDLWLTDRRAHGYNGTYSAELFGKYAVQNILDHNKMRPMVPLFMYLAFTVTHEPIEAPQRFIDMYPSSWLDGRRTYAAMASALDEQVGKVTQALKDTGMWENTLLIFSSDNGGPSLVDGTSQANNYPLRGGKGNAFEGGVRVCAAVSGGFLPEGQRNKKLLTPAKGHMHVADIYATFCGLSGHPHCEDQPGNSIPAHDSYDMWPVLSGQTDESPRKVTVLEYRRPNKQTGQRDAAIISNEWKFVIGRQSGSGKWFGPAYPNSTKKIPLDDPGCPDGCLFNITADPSEYEDIIDQAAVKADLKARLDDFGKTVFQSDSDGKMDLEGAREASSRKDWWRPWLDSDEEDAETSAEEELLTV